MSGQTGAKYCVSSERLHIWGESEQLEDLSVVEVDDAVYHLPVPSVTLDISKAYLNELAQKIYAPLVLFSQKLILLMCLHLVARGAILSLLSDKAISWSYAPTCFRIYQIFYI